MRKLQCVVALPTAFIYATTVCDHIVKPCPAERAFSQSPAERAVGLAEKTFIILVYAAAPHEQFVKA